jgi:hypothetical protein
VVYQAGGNQLAISWNDIARIHLYTITYGYRRPNPWPNFLGVEVHDPSAVWLPEENPTQRINITSAPVGDREW